MKIFNPATEELLKDLQEDTQESLLQKYHELEKGQSTWQNVSLEERIKILNRFSDLLEANIEQLAATLTSEVGKPLQQSRNEINGARTRIAWLTKNASRYLSDESMTDENNLQEKISYDELMAGKVTDTTQWK